VNELRKKEERRKKKKRKEESERVKSWRARWGKFVAILRSARSENPSAFIEYQMSRKRDENFVTALDAALHFRRSLL